jgi:predicted nucleic acid-binding protein
VSLIIDSTLWVDYFRPKTPRKIKERVILFIDSADAMLCHPVRFEILRAALRNERSRIEATFESMPMLATPDNLWEEATELGQKCHAAGMNPPAIDLLIARVGLNHDAEVITFDAHFGEIAKVSPLRVRLLSREGE